MGSSATSGRSKTLSTGTGLAALAASATLFFLGTGLHPWWWVTWFAPLPVLLVASRLRARNAFLVAALAWSIGGLNMWHYMVRILETPVALVLIFLVVPGCLFGLVVLLFRVFIRRGASWKAILAFPCAWVSLEYLNSVTSAHGTFPNLGYTQMDCLPVLQIVSVVGIWGISFCLFLVPTAIAVLWSPHGVSPLILPSPPEAEGEGNRAGKSLPETGGEGNRARRSFPETGGAGSRARNGSSGSGTKIKIAAVTVIVIGGVLIYGKWRLTVSPTSDQSVAVGLLATDAGGRFPDIFPVNDKAALELFRRYADQAKGQKAQVIVLPEKIALLSDEATAQLNAIFQKTAAESKAYIVVGVDRGTKTSRSNEARVYSPGQPSETGAQTGGGLATVYVKHHLLPPFEDVDRPGTELTILPSSAAAWGIQICKDMDFPVLSRQYGVRHVGLLLVPAWDFGRDGWLHSRMAVMRGVESGFTVARVAKTGQLTVSDDRGRVLGEESSAAAPFSSLVVKAPVRHDDTLYLRWGDYFAWANVAGLLFFLFSAMAKPTASKTDADSGSEA
jgi:apolipoprotein N-acyltransferase